MLILLYLFNPIVSSLRGIQQASELKNVQRKLGCPRTSLGSLSEATHVFDPELLKEIVAELGEQLEPFAQDKPLAEIKQTMALVDGTLITALPKIMEASAAAPPIDDSVILLVDVLDPGLLQAHKSHIVPLASACILGQMQSIDLTPVRASHLLDEAHSMLVYLRRLSKGMSKRHFPNDDPLLRPTLKAYDALHDLHVNLHYLSCPSGVRRLLADPDDEAVVRSKVVTYLSCRKSGNRRFVRPMPRGRVQCRK